MAVGTDAEFFHLTCYLLTRRESASYPLSAVATMRSLTHLLPSDASWKLSYDFCCETWSANFCATSAVEAIKSHSLAWAWDSALDLDDVHG